ncbi:hypothetical protein OG612_45590 (plasmid) [Streptomyces sp. NBC_01527]|uniref:hypothetical protein n=1 Tax=Streptomyces sp. NBC_01527 TaxID=2903894 RepID=UPI002F914BF9
MTTPATTPAAPAQGRATAPIEIRYYAEFQHRVQARPDVFEDRLTVTAPRFGSDPIDRYHRPSAHQFSGPELCRARGWRTVTPFEYVAGPNLYRAQVEPAPKVAVPARVVCADGRVRTVTAVAYRPGEPDRFVAADKAEWTAVECLPQMRRCLHQVGAAPHATGNPVTACARTQPTQSVGVFNDEGCVIAYDCAVQAANEAAALNSNESTPGDEPLYTWLPLCTEHEEQPADTCEDCNQN